MSPAQLRSITLTDFRSIKGTISVPLDAPIVLVHGQNGAGKTSLLSGIELALTGGVPSLERVDPDYASHLVHKDAKSARIWINTDGLPRNEAEINVGTDGISGAALLAADLARFYSERCFLAQSSLGRLLELYQDSPKRTDSALTKFVKDLLGLDHFDAIIDGLHDAGDVRRLRSGVPAYAETRDAIPQIENEIERLRSGLAATDSRILELTKHNDERTKAMYAVERHDGKGRPLTAEQEEQELIRLANLRREIEVAHRQWQQVSTTDASRQRVAAQPRSEAADNALQQWNAAQGRELNRLLERLAPLVPDLPPASEGPQHAYSVALASATQELARCSDVLASDAQAAQRETDLSGEYIRAKARTDALEQQISGYAAEAGTLAQALSGLLPHIHSEDCPVCGRDFSEESKTPLHAHLSARITDLTAVSGQLQALNKDRAATLAAASNAERQLGEIRSRRLDNQTRDALRTRQALLQEIHLALEVISDSVAEGQQLLEAAASASRELSDLAALDQSGTALRESLVRFATELNLDPISPTESVDVALSRFGAEAARLEEVYTSNQSIRREMRGNTLEVQRLTAARDPVVSAIATSQARLDQLNAAKGRADSIIHDARELAKRVGEARTTVVRKVFNGSLNRVWRDLFVRLAPEEPFVPAFAVPETNGGPVEAILETWYRSGGKGGNPRAMLSAGNLNTAALTLFLALHLSVTPDLPWLIIDDPVQSMDEVHIAQFAALLRTLAKSKLQRQIVVAVHEKPLFDYLALEFSPAFQNDRLITIELSRSADGQTLMNYQPHVWQPDKAIAA
ncbi:AAA family ATPase [Mesorhizobium sp. WSM4884]|uniref:AAA family ATPase n=1 Tax=Mesorhizobium sp. WSM4884 TaxID=3038542 RepID=UPI0024172709|nr:AAA family ATPase [Mesorhizobium sp. WSM4884]MDG4882011.1 AAA family ATPase [Mesorhizobium sp. WSM4884]